MTSHENAPPMEPGPGALHSDAEVTAPRRKDEGTVQRLLRVAADDTRTIHLRLLFGEPFVGVLPHASFNRLRTQLYRWMGISVGARSIILGPLTLRGHGRIWERLTIGCGSIINSPFHADLGAPIRIGNEVSIGHHVVFVTTDHEVGGPARRCSSSKTLGIVIEDGCWIGACVTILPGVRIGRGSIVSAGSVVSADVAPNKVVGGSPARPIKSLPEDGAPPASTG